MFCRKCGNQINDEQARFCPKCGEQVLNVTGEQLPKTDCSNIVNTELAAVPKNNIGLKLTMIGLCVAALFEFMVYALYAINAKSPSFFYNSASRWLSAIYIIGIFLAGIGHLITFIKQKRTPDLFAALILLLNGMISIVKNFAISILQHQYINDRSALIKISQLSDAIRILIPLTLVIYILMLILRRKKKLFLNVMLGVSMLLSVVSTYSTMILTLHLPFTYFFYCVFESSQLIAAVCLLLCMITTIEEIRTH